VKRKSQFFIIVASFFLFPACATTGRTTTRDTKQQIVRNEIFVPQNWKKIAILPFFGQPPFRRVSGEWFSFRMLEQQDFEVIGPANVEIELKNKKSAVLRDDDGDVNKAKQIGKLLGADAVIVGFIKIEYRLELHALAEVRLIDTRSGEIVASTIQSSPSTFLAFPNEHVHITSATDRVSNDILSVLKELAGQNLGSPNMDKALNGKGSSEGKL
jgi:hypothetical protein